MHQHDCERTNGSPVLGEKAGESEMAVGRKWANQKWRWAVGGQTADASEYCHQYLVKLQA